jgi:hypothetical protein
VRIKHGALIDAQLLAQVYVELTGGRQIGLGLVAELIDPASPLHEDQAHDLLTVVAIVRPAPAPCAERGGAQATCQASWRRSGIQSGTGSRLDGDDLAATGNRAS